MRSSHVWIISAALVIATAIASAASVLGGRYTIITIAGNNVAWKLDRITGQAFRAVLHSRTQPDQAHPII